METYAWRFGWRILAKTRRARGSETRRALRGSQFVAGLYFVSYSSPIVVRVSVLSMPGSTSVLCRTW